MRLLLLITIFTTYLFALTSSPLRTQISTINENILTAETPEGALPGMYGILLRWFNAEHSVALSWVEVTTIEDDVTTLKMIPNYALEQSALPSGTWTAQVGDELILGYNYQRALLIAPNASVYKKITQLHSEREWIHPDIFATLLSFRGHPTPLREDFAYACTTNNIGVLTFAFEQSVLTLDCQSFKILDNRSSTLASSEEQLPFYSRVPHIQANWFGKGSSRLKEYTSYYIELIAENNPENAWIQAYKKQRETDKKNDNKEDE
ncbi:MAG: plasminogen-binding N-terminal domain-containing protein [Campylobacterales bacterium]|nr:plasminogen-binding N-terminal domain-containing protein [Campylobacterales bacterium]